MRKLAVLLATLVVGGILGTLGWQIAVADTATDTLSVCQRPGADLRSPAANGTCPSGYTRVDITETPPTPPTPSSTVDVYSADKARSGSSSTLDVVSLELPPGTYTVVATGTMAGAPRMDCVLYDKNGPLGAVQLATYQGGPEFDHGALNATAFEKGIVYFAIRCMAPDGQTGSTAQNQWRLTATRVDTWTRQ